MNNMVCSLDQLEEVIALGGKDTILIGGELAYVTSSAETMESVIEAENGELIQQPPRNAVRGGAFAKEKTRLFVAVSKEAVRLIHGYRGNAYLLADQYLAYGLSMRGNSIVIGGGVTDEGLLNLEIFIFSGQRLEQTVERTAEHVGPRLDMALHDILREYPDHQVHWCYPLPAPPICDLSQRLGFVEADDAPFKSLVRRKIFSKSQAAVEPIGWIPAALLAGVGACVLGGVIAIQWAKVASERAEYRAEIEGYEDAYQNSSQSLDLLRHRDFLLKSEPVHLQRVALVDLMLRSVAQIPGVIIDHVRFYDDNDMRASSLTQSATGTAAANRDDFSVEIRVPADDMAGSARDQAEPMLAELNFKTGMSIRVVDHGGDHVKVGEEEKPYWRYRLGGSIQ